MTVRMETSLWIRLRVRDTWVARERERTRGKDELKRES